MSGPMKVKPLSLSRRTQTPPRNEESMKSVTADEVNVSNLDAILNSPIARPTRICSTPIQKNVDITEDSPDQDYRSSPTSLFPCTQDSNEIAWDWTCAEDKSGKNNATPKRAQQRFKKKRMAKAYSPLLNIPAKRKMDTGEVANNIGKFAAELQALADLIRTEQDEENKDQNNGTKTVKETPETDSKNSRIYDMETQKVFDIHEVNTLEVSYVAEAKVNPEKPDSSLDDLFDDSVDACMVQCSQEIENKLQRSSEKSKSKSVLSSSNEDVHGAQKTGCGTSKSSSNHLKSTEKSNSKNLPICPKLSGNDIPQSQILDDSMDDCLALCLDDDADLFSKYLDKEKQVDTPKKVNHSSAKESVLNYSNSLNDGNRRNLKSNNAAVEVGSNFKRKQQCMGFDNAQATNENRKYFKSKSLSDSFFCENSLLEKSGKLNSNLGKSYPPPMTKSTSNCIVSMKPIGKGIQMKISSTPNLNNFIPTAGSRNNSSHTLTSKPPSNSTVSYSYLRSSIDNIAANSSDTRNRDPYASLVEVVKPLNEMRTTMPSNSQLYNPEEIERKRLEAKMRLEANRLKKQMNSNKGISSFQNKKPVVKR